MIRALRTALVMLVVAQSALLAQPARTQSALDEWIVLRYRGAQLLPDSLIKGATAVSLSGPPRIEGERTPLSKDTLVALHFNALIWRPLLDVGTTATLADPTGVESKLQGRISVRRAFRAPRTPGAKSSDSTQWRIGWAYLFVVPPRTASASANAFEGWSIVEPARGSPPRPASKPAPGRRSNSGISPRTRADSLE